MKLIQCIVTMCILFLTTGFGQSVSISDRNSELEDAINDKTKIDFIMPEPLSNLIAQPLQFSVPVLRDPFEPLLKPQQSQQIAKEVQEEREQEIIKEMDYSGVIKWGDQFSALIKMGDDKGVYQLNDQINGLTIVDIDEEKIVLKKGSKTYQLQRGDK